jgi:3-isopropylmalate dehydrogenase
MRAAETADAVLLGAMGLPDVRYPDGTEVQPHLDLRDRFALYAGVRPFRLFSGAPTPLADQRASRIDCVLVRESTEGLFASRTLTRRISDEAVLDTMRITRSTSERLFEFAFDLARARARERGRPARVTCVDKANVIPSLAFFRSVFLECAARHRDVASDCVYVDAAGLKLVRSPWEFDVLVTENMFGDILSDVGAALVGGMGMAPSADIGDAHAVFQPCHGTAPDIAGRGLANPTAMILSAGMMLEWLGDRHDSDACRAAARDLRTAIERAFARGDLLTPENGGTAGTLEVASRVREELESLPARSAVSR